jgi:hypothetical protein
MSDGGDDIHEIRTVSVAFDPVCTSPALLQAATDLAVWLGADLEALFIDDQDIVRLSKLPFGRMFEPLSGKSILFDDAAVRSHRAGPVARSRAVLRELSKRHRLACSVRELPGLALAEATGKSSAELFILSSFHAKFGSDRTIDREALEVAPLSAGSVLLVSQFPVSTRSIVVVGDDSAAARRAVALAERLVLRGASADTALIGRLNPEGQRAPELIAKVSAMSPTLVIVGLADASLVAGLQEKAGTEPFSVLTVR